MQATFSPAGLELCLSSNQRSKYLSYIEWYLKKNCMSCQEASELSGKSAWCYNALFGRCRRAFLVPILRRAANPAAQLKLNGRLRSALKWWHRWSSCPAGHLTRSVLASPKRGPLLAALTCTDGSTDYGLGGVLLPIDYLKVEAAVVADGVFGPMLQQLRYHEEISFVDNNVSLAWITDDCAFCDDVNPLIENMWFGLACRQAFEWCHPWERVSSVSNSTDLPSRGQPPVLSSEWDLREIQGVRRWEPPVSTRL